MSDKTEKPTERRKQKARERGEVARSRELAASLVLLSALGVLAWQARQWPAMWRGYWTRVLGEATTSDITATTPLLGWTGHLVLSCITPVLATAFGVAGFAMAAQGGLYIAVPALSPKFARLNPATNLKNLFSLAGINRALKSLIPLAAIVYLSAYMISGSWGQMMRASHYQPQALLYWTLDLVHRIAWYVGLTMLGYAGIEYGLERLRHDRDLRMSKQEVKDEARENEGNTTIKARIRRLQRQMRKRRVVQDVKTATVVVTNPTTFAVALRYDMATMAAPVVVAKGQNLLAQQIKQLARWHDIPVLENKPLARALYRSVEVGQAIPAELYTAVAEILAFIFRAQQRVAKPHPER